MFWPLQYAVAGDPEIAARLEEGGRHLGVGFANLVNLYNPGMIILGGRLPLEAQVFWETAARTAVELYYPVLRHQTLLVRSRLGRDACVVGAASLVLRSLFRPVRISTSVP